MLDLADEQDFALQFRAVFAQNGYLLKVPPTVARELAFFCRQNVDQDLKRLSSIALQSMHDWGIALFDLMPVQRGITEVFVRRLMERKLLPDEEKNAGEILAETALAEIPVLVTSDHHLLDIPESDLRLCFDDSGLCYVAPTHPRRLLRAAWRIFKQR